MSQDNGSRAPWLWGAGGCCLGCVVLPLLAVSVLGIGAFGALAGSDVVTAAVARARADPAVQEALGTPIRRGWLVQGSIHTGDEGGRADVRVPLSGPQASGDLHVAASRLAGEEWQIHSLELELEDGERLRLGGGESGPPAAAPTPPPPPEAPPSPLPPD